MEKESTTLSRHDIPRVEAHVVAVLELLLVHKVLCRNHDFTHKVFRRKPDEG